MKENDYDEFYGKRIENFSFFYPLSQIWNLNPKLRNFILIIGILSVVGLGFVAYLLIFNKLSNSNSTTLIFAIGVVLGLLGPVAIIYILFNKCKFNAGIYSKGIEIQLGRGRLYSELKEVKIFQYSENGNDYIKLIYIEFDDKITTENFLYNPKMDKFLDKIQESFKKHGISCEKITDIKDIDISEPIEYKAHFWFFKVWRLLSGKEKWKRLKGSFIAYLLALLLLLFPIFGHSIRHLSLENIKSSTSHFFIMAGILLIFIVIYFIFSTKTFYARKENNAVYIRKYNGLTNDYVFSKIKANYGIIIEGNIEGIELTINDGKKNIIYKRPKNQEVERFCNDLLAEIRKRKTA